MNKKLLLIIIYCLLLTGCVDIFNYKNKNDHDKNNTVLEKSKIKENDKNMLKISAIINNENYIINLENNETVEEFIKLLPQEYKMNELNGNEKYIYLNTQLPTNSLNPKRINAGDVMLYGNNCLVIFYKSFDTSYAYTKIGHIDNLPDLGNSDVLVKFE